MKKSLKRLAIDTATKNLYVALFEGDQCLSDFWESGNNDHSVKLMVELEKMMKKNNLKVADLDEIIIGIGPGSYTGLRIGVVVAKMLAWNNDIPVKTISSLALISSSYGGDKLILSEIDARRGNSFLGLYKNDGESLIKVDEEALVNLNDYAEKTKIKYDCDLEIVSEGRPDMKKILSSELLQSVSDIHSLNPNYLRLTEAERNLK